MAPRSLAVNGRPVGAHEHREAAIEVFQTDRHRGLAVLVRSYGKRISIQRNAFVEGTCIPLPQQLPQHLSKLLTALLFCDMTPFAHHPFAIDHHVANLPVAAGE